MSLTSPRACATFVLLAATHIALATAYHVSPAGDDAASGTSPAQAWRTIDRVNAAALAPGDSVLFARGGTWRGQLRPPASGTPANPITFAAYGEGARPLLLGSIPVGGDPTAWEDLGDGVYRYRPALGYDAGSLSFDGDDARLGVKRASREALRDPGDFHVEQATKQLYLRADDNPGRAYAAIEAALTRDIVAFGDRSHLTFAHLHLRRGAAHGLAGASTTGITIADCEIAWIGGGYLPVGDRFERYGNGVEFWGATRGARVTRNFIHDIFDSGLTNQYFVPPAADQVDIAYVANVLVRCGLASFEMANSTGGLSQDIRFANNTSVAAGEGWGRYDGPQREGPAAGAKIGAHVAFTNAQIPSDANGLEIVNNVFYGSIRMFTFRNEAFAMWEQTTLRNNLYYAPDPAGIQLYATYDNATQSGTSYGYDQFEAYRAEQGKDENSLQADPLFVDLAAGDYRPRAGSPLIGAGDGGVTIGAFEFADAGSDPGRPFGDVDDGYTYQLLRQGTTQAADVVWNLATPANVQLWEANPTFGQAWTALLREDSSAFALRHFDTDQCLAVEGDASAPGANVYQTDCDDSPAQAWAILPHADDTYTVRHVGSGQVLTADGEADGVNVTLSADAGSQAQRWIIRPTDVQLNGAATTRASAPVQGFAVSPNPTAGELAVRLDEPLGPGATYALFDVGGARRLTRAAGHVPAGELTFALELAHLPSGTYVLQLRDGESRLQQQVTVSQ